MGMDRKAREDQGAGGSGVGVSTCRDGGMWAASEAQSP
jgi:hypothetical protein